MVQKGSEILFAGSLGKLHGYYYDVPYARSVALVLPPHPKHGGTMKNKVVKTIYSCFVKRGIATLRMNYRGIGYSSGQISMRDEDLLKDASAAIEWLQSCYPLASSFWVSGFSYGAWLSLNLVMRRPEISGFIAVSSPLKIHDFSFLSPCTVPGLMIQGDQDQLSDVPELLRLASPISERLSKFKVEFIENADFRLSGESDLEILEQKIDDYLVLASVPARRVYEFSEELEEREHAHSDIYAEEQLLVEGQL